MHENHSLEKEYISRFRAKFSSKAIVHIHMNHSTKKSAVTRLKTFTILIHFLHIIHVWETSIF